MVVVVIVVVAVAVAVAVAAITQAVDPITVTKVDRMIVAMAVDLTMVVVVDRHDPEQQTTTKIRKLLNRTNKIYYDWCNWERMWR